MKTIPDSGSVEGRAPSRSAGVLRLVPKPQERRQPSVNRNTVDCLMQLLERALRGEVVGLAFAAQLPDRRYFTDVAGETQDSPTFARGMVAVLGDEIAQLIRAK